METKFELLPNGAVKPDGIRSQYGKTKRFSKNREQVLACVKSTKCHPTAEWVYAQLKSQHLNIGRTTVYRNLRELQEAGDIISLGAVGETERFDGFTEPHIHGVCERCGAVMDIPDAALPMAIAEKAKAVGFAVSTAQVRLYGVCAACQEGDTNG